MANLNVSGLSIPRYEPRQTGMPSWLTDILTGPTVQEKSAELAKQQASAQYQQALSQQLEESMAAKREEKAAAELLSQQLRAWYDTPEDQRKDALSDVYLRSAMESGSPSHIQAAAEMLTEMEEQKVENKKERDKQQRSFAMDVAKQTGLWDLVESSYSLPKGSAGILSRADAAREGRKGRSGKTADELRAAQLLADKREREAEREPIKDKQAQIKQEIDFVEDEIKSIKTDPDYKYDRLLLERVLGLEDERAALKEEYRVAGRGKGAVNMPQKEEGASLIDVISTLLTPRGDAGAASGDTVVRVRLKGK